MPDILTISASYKDHLIFTSNYLDLFRTSSSLSRSIVLYNVNCVKYKQLEYGEKLKIEIYLYNKYGSKIYISDFEIVLHEFSDLASGKEFSAKGIITFSGPYYHDYDQDIADIYNRWQNEQEVNFWALDLVQKENYISCCANWSGLPQQFEKDNYTIDCTPIKEEVDLYYIFGLTFAGERGYFGSSTYTLEDCLIESIRNNKPRPTIMFTNYESLLKVISIENMKEIITTLKKFGFGVNVA